MIFLILLASAALADLLQNYEPEVFNELPEFDDARREASSYQKTIEELLELTAEYALEGHVTVQILHKHFNLTETEILLETSHPESSEHLSVSEPALREHHLEAIPHVFRFADSGSSTLLFPLEFVRSSVLGIAAASEAVFANHSYLRDFSDVLKRTGLAGVLGFGIRHENQKGGTMENSSCHERKSYVKEHNCNGSCDTENCVRVGFHVDRDVVDGCCHN
jgi:hypothetical protein